MLPMISVSEGNGNSNFIGWDKLSPGLIARSLSDQLIELPPAIDWSVKRCQISLLW